MKNSDIYKIEDLLSASGTFNHSLIEENICIDNEIITLSDSINLFVLQKHINKNIHLIENVFDTVFSKVDFLLQKNKSEELFDPQDEFYEIATPIETAINEIDQTNSDIESFLDSLKNNLLDDNNFFQYKSEVLSVIDSSYDKIEHISKKMIRILSEIDGFFGDYKKIEDIHSEIETLQNDNIEYENDKNLLENEESEDEEDNSLNESEINELERSIYSNEQTIESLFDDINNILEEHSESKYNLFLNKYINNDYNEEEILNKATDVNDFFIIFHNILREQYLSVLEDIDAEIEEFKVANNHLYICQVYNKEDEKKLKTKEFLTDNSYLGVSLKGLNGIDSILVFSDLSSTIKYSNGEVKNNFSKESTWDFINKNQNVFIEDIFRKKPIYIKQFKKIFKEELKYAFNDKNFFVDENHPILVKINDLKNNINNYSSIIENSEFKTKIKNCEFKKLEQIDDHIEKIIYEHKIKKFAYSLVSNKNKNIIDDKTISIIKSFFDKNIDTKTIREGVGKKIASIKTSDDFNELLIKERNNFFQWGSSFILDKINNLNVDIVKNENNILILDVKDFESSKILGSPSWCISRSNHYFSQYTNNDNRTQYFLYDFSKSPDDKLSTVGITTMNQENGFDILYAHNKNDGNIRGLKEIKKLYQEESIINHQNKKYNHKKTKKMAP